MNNWILISERLPTHDDFPACGGCYEQNGEWSHSSFFRAPNRDGTMPWDACRTHWLSMAKPPKPSPALNQPTKMDSEKPADGGPAFPCESFHEDAHGSWPKGFAGMSLRDYFASAAMASMFAGPGATMVANRDGRYDETNWADVVAANAYEMADAMLKKRAGKSNL